MKKHFASSATGARTRRQIQHENIQQTFCRVEMEKEHPGVQQSHTRFLFTDERDWASLVLPFILRNYITIKNSILSIRAQQTKTCSILLKLVLCQTFKRGHYLVWHHKGLFHKGLFAPLNDTFILDRCCTKWKETQMLWSGWTFFSSSSLTEELLVITYQRRQATHTHTHSAPWKHLADKWGRV